MSQRDIDAIREKRNIENKLKEIGGARFFTKIVKLTERTGILVGDTSPENFGNTSNILKKGKIKISTYYNCCFSLSINIYYEKDKVLALRGTVKSRLSLTYTPEICFSGTNYCIEKYSHGKWEQEIKKICS